MADLTDRLSTALADRYRIVRHLGEGGMANVYLAEDLKHDRKVAVKVLRPELAAVLGADRFVQEIKTTASLQHPHILPLFDSGRARVPPLRGAERGTGGEAPGQEFLFYVMPYVEGETLRDKLNRETQLGIEEAVKIATEAADALDYAHRHGVIHRDVKPENILLHDGRPMVADFGIALAVSAAAGGRMTETGLSLGTPHYMSPEQATAEKEITNRSDIYSLGCVLYEMLAGAPPHLGGSAQQIIMKIVTDTPRPITELRKSVPPNVAAAVHKSLQKLAADRFASAATFAEALTNPAFSVSTRHAPGSTSDESAISRHRVTILFAAIAAISLGVATWAVTRPEPRHPAIHLGLRLSPDEQFIPQFGPGFALSPDGRTLVYSGPSSSGEGPGTPLLRGAGVGSLWVRELDRPHATQLRGVRGNVWTFSPDGRSIAYVGPGPSGAIAVQVASLDGEPPRTVLDTTIWYPWSLDWERDHIYFQSREGLARLPEGGGQIELLVPPDSTLKSGFHFWTDVLPNERGALVSIIPDNGDLASYRIGVADFARATVRELTPGVFARYAPSGHVVFVRDDGTMLAAPFDQDALRITGPAVELLENVGIGATGGAAIALSTNGLLVYGTWDSQFTDVLRVSVGGVAEPADSAWTGFFHTPAMSPDGTRLAVSVWGTTTDIWIKDVNQGPFTRLTFAGSRNTDPVWTRDGRSVVFLSDRGRGVDLYMKPTDGTGDATRILDAPNDILGVSGSTRSDWFAYSAGPTHDRNIYAFRLGADSVGVPIATSPFDERSPAVSPDGRWIAYVSNESNEDEVYVRRLDGEGGRQLVSVNGGVEAVWAADGRQLFYRDGSNQLIVVDVVLGPDGFSAGPRRTLFSMDPYLADANQRALTATPDGDFVMTRTQGAAAGQLNIILNFFDELREKVGN